MQYTYNNNGVIETVDQERWRWVAVYQDGTQLYQFDDKGIFHKFSEIDTTKLRQFVMQHDTLPSFFINFDQSMKLIHYYKGLKQVGMDGEVIADLKSYYFGYSQRYEGKEVYTLIMITPEDKFVLTDNREITAW